MDYRGKTALVTGGSSGIGRELVRALVAKECRVLTCGRRESALKELADELPGQLEYIVCDISTSKGRSQLVTWTKSQAAALDLLFNNAGIQFRSLIDPDLDQVDVELELATNLIAPIMLCAELAPMLSAGNDACVVNLSSGLAIAPKATGPVYCASKAALSNFSRSLRFQFEPKGIHVVDVITPLVKTPMTEGRNNRAMAPEKFVASLLDQLSSRKDEIYIGISRLLPTMLRLVPNLTRNMLRHS